MASRTSGGGTVLASGIRTREKKERKLYSDDWALGDEEIEGHHTFDIDEKVTTDKFNVNFVKDMSDVEFSLAYMQKHGFNWPLLFKEKKKLGIVIPNEFSINDVRLCVGSRRMLDVMDVNTQKNVEMTMKDWQRYYESQDKDKLLNVISLEFSHTKLENLVEAPTVVRQIDWVEKVWPRHLKEAQTESTNVLEDMMYPKVQKYCLMSVSGCYTDFHIDFGGTSVWYHILKGRKIFWLIPPSERNLQLYEQWVLSGKQSDIFFGDTVEKCARVQLEAGYTFFIPTGWIHAVYTPDDSLVFGGNFLHSFGIEKQLRIAHVEDTTHVPQKFRYPFFTEMLWYLLERYVHILLGRTHLTLPNEEQERYEKSEFCLNLNNNKEEKEHVHLTQYELHGLKAIVMYLHSLPTSKKSVPELIRDPIALIRDVRTVVEQHRYDSPDLAVTDTPIMDWWDREPVRYTVKRSYSDVGSQMKKRRQSTDDHTRGGFAKPPNSANQRHRRVRCKECDPCTRADCRDCSFCKDMTKYGGPGTMKQTCKYKKCEQPVMGAAVLCYVCGLDGWNRSAMVPTKAVAGIPSNLIECIVCYKISHKECVEPQFKGHEGVVNEDITNSWECPECVSLGYNKEFKHNRVPSSRISSVGSDSNAKSPPDMSEPDEEKKVKVEPLSEGSQPAEPKSAVNGDSKTEKNTVVDPTPPKMPTWDQLQARVSFPLVRPSWVVRPAPPPPEEEVEEDSGSESETKTPVPSHLTTTKAIMLRVFHYLPKEDLLSVMRVCRQWATWAINPSLWRSIDFVHCTIDTHHLIGIVRRQPHTLRFNWSRMRYKQFLWLVSRIPQLASLSLEGISFGVFRALVSPYCPALTKLNISFCEGINNDTLGALLRPPPFNRPGHRDTASRLRQLTHLWLAGTRVGDVGIGVIVRSLPFLTHLDMNSCTSLTDGAVELLASPSSIVSHSLKNLDLRWCTQMTPMILPSLAALPLLSDLSIDPCPLIPFKAIEVWGKTHGYSFDKENKMSRPTRKLSTEDPLSDGENDPSEQVSSSQVKKEETAKEEIPKEEKKEGKNKKRKSEQKSSEKKDSSESGKEEEVPAESSESCRRSERSSKSSSTPSKTPKHKPTPPRRRGSQSTGEDENGDSSKTRSSSSTPKELKKKKKMMTRSKSVVSKTPVEGSSEGRPSRSKEEKIKEGNSKPSKSSSTKSPKYSSKLRKKSQDDVETSSEDNRKKSKEVSTPPPKKRPRKSSTSSSSCSPSVLLPTKKLKIELEQIGKINRRKSEGQKPLASGSSDKASNRDRPERQHRSPRRLSMCQ